MRFADDILFKVIGFMIDSTTTMETVRRFLLSFADNSFHGLRLYQPVLHVVTTDLDARENRRIANNRGFVHILSRKIVHAKTGLQSPIAHRQPSLGLDGGRFGG